MRTKVQVALNGAQLHEIDESVIVQQVIEQAPTLKRATIASGTHVGQLPTTLDRLSLDVQVVFSLRGKDDRAKRMQTLQRIAAWATDGGWLTVNYRTGERLRVECDALPNVGDIKKWNGTYTLTFRAYAVPYWQQTAANESTASAASGSVTLSRGGNAEAPLLFSYKNTGSADVNAVTVTCAGQKIALSGLALKPGETVALEYDDRRNMQSIRIAGGSAARDARPYRSADSSDDIMLRAASNAVGYSASAAGQWTFRTFGRWRL